MYIITEIFPCYSYHINLGYNVTLFALNSVPDTSSYPVMIDQDLEGVSQFLSGYLSVVLRVIQLGTRCLSIPWRILAFSFRYNNISVVISLNSLADTCYTGLAFWRKGWVRLSIPWRILVTPTLPRRLSPTLSSQFLGGYLLF